MNSTQSAAILSERVRTMFSCLFGSEIIIRPLQKLPPLRHGMFVACYVTDDNSEVSYVVCDFGFAVSSGAALTLISPRIAVDYENAGTAQDAILDNFREVLNVCVGFYSDSTNDRLRLGSVTPILCPEVWSPDCSITSVFTCEVEIDRYPKGFLQFYWNE